MVKVYTFGFLFKEIGAVNGNVDGIEIEDAGETVPTDGVVVVYNRAEVLGGFFSLTNGQVPDNAILYPCAPFNLVYKPERTQAFGADRVVDSGDFFGMARAINLVSRTSDATPRGAWGNEWEQYQAALEKSPCSSRIV